MKEQVLLTHLRDLRKIHIISSDALLTQRHNIVSHFSGIHVSFKESNDTLFENIGRYFRTILEHYVMSLSGGIAMVLIMATSVGALTFFATPNNHLLYKIGSSVERMRIALYPEVAQRKREVALLSYGARDIDSLKRDAATVAVQTVVAQVEGRFARVAGYLQGAESSEKDFPFVLLVDTANSAEMTAQALSQFSHTAPISLQPAIAEALNTVTRTKRAAVAVMVTYTDAAQGDSDINKSVGEAVRKELVGAQESLDILVADGGGSSRFDDADETLAQAEKAFQEGDYAITLSLINEAEGIAAHETGFEQSNGLVEGESIDMVDDFSATTSPVYETSTDEIIEGKNELPEYSRNSNHSVTTNLNSRVFGKKDIPAVIPVIEQEEFSVGFDL